MDKKKMRDLLVTEYGKVWDKNDMVEYCVKKAAAVAILPDDNVIVVKKQPIATKFCFGESGYDYVDALRMADHARTSEDYFYNENMEHYDNYIRRILESMNNSGNSKLIIYDDGAYYSQTPDCHLRNCNFVRMVDIIEACGGECRIDELPGKPLVIDGRKCHVATGDECLAILEAWQTARAAHNKKVVAYLKKYGLSKVHSWTYWRDA